MIFKTNNSTHTIIILHVVQYQIRHIIVPAHNARVHSDKTAWLLQSPYNSYEYYYFASLVCIYMIYYVLVYIMYTRCYCDDYNAWRSFTSEVRDARGFRNYNIILRTLLYRAVVGGDRAVYVTDFRPYIRPNRTESCDRLQDENKRMHTS